jgi:hypothetical protein
VDEAEELVRVDAVEVHEPGQRGAVVVEIHLLHPARLGMVAAQQVGDIHAHAHVDLVEQACRAG